MLFKIISQADSSRLADIPLDHEWDATIGNGFIIASSDMAPRIADALERLNIHGAADLAVGAIEWCLARVQRHVDLEDAGHRLQAAWAATVDARYAALTWVDSPEGETATPWSRSEWLARIQLFCFGEGLGPGYASKVRQGALGAILQAEHLCGRDTAFGTWVAEMLRAKAISSPRSAEDHDDAFQDRTPATPQELVLPSREERLAGLDPSTNPYLRPASEMVALGFVGKPYALAP